MTTATLNHIAGALAGMVLGDALGVPGELWPREKVRARFGHIDRFIDGPEDNIVACYFKAGHYTDDSAQAFVILKALLKAGTVRNQSARAFFQSIAPCLEQGGGSEARHEAFAYERRRHEDCPRGLPHRFF